MGPPTQESAVNVPQESQSPTLVEFCNYNEGGSTGKSTIQGRPHQYIRGFSLETETQKGKGPETMSFGNTNFKGYMKLKNLKVNDQGVIFY